MYPSETLLLCEPLGMLEVSFPGIVCLGIFSQSNQDLPPDQQVVYALEYESKMTKDNGKWLTDLGMREKIS